MMLLHDLYDDGVGRQQDFFVALDTLGDYGFIFSHTLHDVAGVGGGTIMVQRGYSIELEDQEVLPHRKDSPICSSIMVDDFGIWHVKEWSYEMTGALLQRPTSLSLGSLGLLMECS